MMGCMEKCVYSKKMIFAYPYNQVFSKKHSPARPGECFLFIGLFALCRLSLCSCLLLRSCLALCRLSLCSCLFLRSCLALCSSLFCRLSFCNCSFLRSCFTCCRLSLLCWHKFLLRHIDVSNSCGTKMFLLND
jgi:hypothetical protein